MNFNPNKFVMGISQAIMGMVFIGVSFNTDHYFIDFVGGTVLLVSALLSFKEVPKK